MLPDRDSWRERKAEKEDELGVLSQLEGQRKEAGDIVYRWFRFRVRRSLGLFYSLLSVLPVLGSILGTLVSQNVALVGVTVGIVCIWIAARSVGFQGFGRMRSTIDLLKEDDSAGGRGRELRRTATFLFISVWPWVAYAAASVLGQRLLEVLFALIWLLEFVAYRVFTLRRNRNPIVSHTIEDWLVVFCIPIAALVSAVQIIPNASPFFGFVLGSPFLLFAGVKSLYDAPKELVGGLVGESE